VTAPDAPEPIGRTPRQVAGPEVDLEREDDAGDSPAVDLRERPGSDPDREVEPEPTGDADPEVEPEPTGDADPEVEPEPTGDADREVEPEPAAEPEPVGFELASAMDPDPEIGPDDGFDDGFMGETDELRRRWEAVQAGFVDDPRRTVEQADEMVSAAVAALQAHIEQRREDLAETWRDGAQASTDALLAAFQRYRELFEGVLST
jgi:hypothetical protein